ncbi:vWA domain-containing protein [Sulfurimonas sp. HSL-1656]|uniref:vWA domain-containing protein n=1 Tax=Thiomicrolovo subterrani TaxID=3131934 RepID=UPI0031F96E94
MKKLLVSSLAAMALAGTLAAQKGDIVFVIDNSGSMNSYINVVKNNVHVLVDKLVNEGIDFQLGLVAFGYGYTGAVNPLDSTTNPVVLTPLTTDINLFNTQLHTLNGGGTGYEPGFAAVARSMSGAMETPTNKFRDDAGACVILLSNEDADDGDITDTSYWIPWHNKPVAIAAMQAHNATFYGIINPGFNRTYDDYGMNPGSLAVETGGYTWNINELSNPALQAAILEEVFDKCIYETIITETPVDFDVHPRSCPNPITTKSKGVIPMAILGSDMLDVNDINVSSVTVNGVSPVHYSYEDNATVYTGGFSEEPLKDECTTLGADGYMDLVMHFDTQSVVSGLELGVQYLEVTGTLLDGTPFRGKDVVWVK